MAGMLGARVLGFQDYSFVRHCIHSASRLLGLDHTPMGIELDGMPICFTVLPMGLHVTKAREKIRSEAVQRTIFDLKAVYGQRPLLVSVDKSEQIKGVLHKLEGFRILFREYPQWVEQRVIY